MGSVSDSAVFGKPMREHFLFDKDFTNLNHGSFGTYPKSVRDEFRRLQDLAEAAPDRFMRFQYADYLLASRRAVAKLLNVPVDTCVFLQNATLGVNTVLRNLVYGPGDVIIYFDTIYGACEKTILSILETTQHVRARKVAGYEFPCEHEEIVEKFLEVVKGVEEEGLKAKVAIFDTICALPGVRFPFERLTEECRRLGILSCLDAAHGIGQIPLDVGKLDPDFLISNCHKWLFTPRGCAVLHVPHRNQGLIRTSYPTSHGFVPAPDPACPSPEPVRNPLPASPTTSAFVTLFQFVATTDNAPYYCVPAAVSFRDRVCGGEDAVMRYLRHVAAKGGNRVAQTLGTEVMGDVVETGKLRDCAFANVRLPITISGAGPEHSHDGSSGEGKGDVRPDEVARVVEYMQQTFLDEFDTFIAVYEYKGRLWTRLSGQVYLDDDQDWRWCGSVLAEVCARVREGRFRDEGVDILADKLKGISVEMQ